MASASLVGTLPYSSARVASALRASGTSLATNAIFSNFCGTLAM